MVGCNQTQWIGHAYSTVANPTIWETSHRPVELVQGRGEGGQRSTVASVASLLDRRFFVIAVELGSHKGLTYRGVSRFSSKQVVESTLLGQKTIPS